MGQLCRIKCVTRKLRVWFDDYTIYLDFPVIFLQIAPSKPLYQGPNIWQLFAAKDDLWAGPTRLGH